MCNTFPRKWLQFEGGRLANSGVFGYFSGMTMGIMTNSPSPPPFEFYNTFDFVSCLFSFYSKTKQLKHKFLTMTESSNIAVLDVCAP